MSALNKIKKSWWVIFSFIIFLNGFGFIYIALRHNNRNWLFEGIMYELPWFFYLIVYALFGMQAYLTNPASKILTFAFILMVIGIIRSFWVAIKLFDVYAYDEKPEVKQVNPDYQSKTQNKGKLSEVSGCCLCVFFICIMFAIISVL